MQVFFFFYVSALNSQVSTNIYILLMTKEQKLSEIYQPPKKKAFVISVVHKKKYQSEWVAIYCDQFIFIFIYFKN